MHRERKVDICCDGSKGQDDFMFRTSVLAVSLERMESETKMGAIYTYCYSVPYLIRHHISQIQAMALNSVAC